STDLLKLVFHSAVVLAIAAPMSLLWAAWRLLTGVAALPHHLYQAGDDVVFSFYQRLVIILIEDVVGCKVFFHGDMDDVAHQKERAFYVVNHQSTFDWVAVNMFAERTGSPGQLRYIVKQSLQSLPLYGFYFQQHGCIYVNRQQFDAYKMRRSLAYLRNKNMPSSIVIFPEGALYEPGHTAKLKKSYEFARRRGLQPLRQHLMPRTQGFAIAMQSMREYLDAVYSVTFIYGTSKMAAGGRRRAPSLFDMFSGKCDEIHMHVKRTPVEMLPEDDKGLKKFLIDLFYEKDALLEAYYGEDGTPPELSEPMTVPCHQLQNHVVLLLTLIFVCFCFFTAVGRSLVWKTWLYGSIFGYSWLGMNSVA
ncbi:unnamed protein product, partial [Ixodes hexagonus]